MNEPSSWRNFPGYKHRRRKKKRRESKKLENLRRRRGPVLDGELQLSVKGKGVLNGPGAERGASVEKGDKERNQRTKGQNPTPVMATQKTPIITAARLMDVPCAGALFAYLTHVQPFKRTRGVSEAQRGLRHQGGCGAKPLA